MTDQSVVCSFVLNGPVVPKARARVTKNGTFHPARYQEWMKDAMTQLHQRWQREPIDYPVKLTAHLHRRCKTGDADNLVGSLLDVLVKSGILANDHIAIVPSVSVDAVFYGKAEMPEDFTTIVLSKV